MARKKPGDAALALLRELGLAYPGAHTKSPWPGHLDLAVKDKTFAFLSVEGDPFSITCKLPRSSSIALMLPFTSPAGYGLGKSGWVTAKVPDDAGVPVELFQEWIDESYRAQAPKTLVKQLDAAAGEAAAKPRAAAGKAAGKAAAKPRAAAGKAAGKTAAKPRAAAKKPRAAAKKGRSSGASRGR